MRLKEICDYISRGTTPDYVDESPYKVMNQATFSKGRLDEDNIRYTSKNVREAQIKKGDLLMASTGGGVLGKVFFFDSDDTSFYADSHVSILRNSKGKNLMKYLYYVFSIKYDEINATMVKGSTNQTELQRNYLLAYEMDIPSLSKQQRIVYYLDAKLGKIDARIAVLVKQQDAYARLKKSVVHHAVTRGLNPNVSLKDSGVEWIGMIPEHWEVKRIKELCSFVSRGATPNYVDEGEYKVMNQAVFSTGNLNHKVVRYSSYMKSESQIKKGDLLIASTGGGVLGKLYFFDDEDLNFYADTHVTIVRSEKGLFCVKFLFYLLSYQFDMVNACMAKGSTNQTELQRDCLLSYELAIPSLVEQQTIIAYLDEKCAKIDTATENIGKQIDALKRLKRALINEVVTGQRAI
jgi:type I restriction enzyme S subunit